ncbi:MAG: radical SAM protein, partial [Thermoguttaceae bacterium]
MSDGRPLVLLVQLPVPPPSAEPIRGNVPLAAGCLKLFARRRSLEDSFRIEILPTASANTLGDQGLVEEILGRGPLLVGFTCYLWNIQRTLWIAGRLRAAEPAIRVLLGGPEITADNRWVLKRPEVDFAVFGEGEATFAELLAALGTVPVFALRKRDGPPLPFAIAGLWRAGGPPPVSRPSLDSLDTVSSPYLEGILDAGDERLMLLETSRGCRYRCRFCYYPKSYRKVYTLSPERISACLRHAADRGVAEVVLLDPSLNQRPDFLGLVDLLARGNPERQFTYSAELRAEGIGPKAARAMRKANFHEVEIGLQSIDPEAQRLMGRRINLPAFERGARALLDEGISVRLDLIVGLPGDTVDSVRRGIEYLDRVRPFSELQVFNLSILPGTAFREQAQRLGLEYQARPPYYVLRTPTLDIPAMYGLMEEVQDAFGIEFDPLGPPRLEGDCPSSRVSENGNAPFARLDGDCPNFRVSENGTVPFARLEGDCPNFRVSENGTVPFARLEGDCPNFRVSENGTVPFAARAVVDL